MGKPRSSQTVHIALENWIIDEDGQDEPVHAISVVASRAGLRKTTLLRYEEWGLVAPVRSGRQRLYSEADIERVLRARRLIDDLGLNLAGAAAVLHLRQQVISLQQELQALREQNNQ